MHLCLLTSHLNICKNIFWKYISASIFNPIINSTVTTIQVFIYLSFRSNDIWSLGIDTFYFHNDKSKHIIYYYIHIPSTSRWSFKYLCNLYPMINVYLTVYNRGQTIECDMIYRELWNHSCRQSGTKLSQILDVTFWVEKWLDKGRTIFYKYIISNLFEFIQWISFIN